MTSERVAQHQFQNFAQTVLLLCGMFGLLVVLGWWLSGLSGLVIGMIIASVFVVIGPAFAKAQVLRRFRARKLDSHSAPELVATVAELARRARLRRTPELYYIPSPVPNAFAVGRTGDAAIAVTDGLLRTLRPRELGGVLAHEMGHIRNRDLWVMAFADFFTRTTSGLSTIGKVLLLIQLPLLLTGSVAVSPWLLLLLLSAPGISVLLQLAVSRTREFDADLAAVQLTGDPEALASALARLEPPSLSFWQRIFGPPRDLTPSYLRTHPATKARIARLRSLTEREPSQLSQMDQASLARQLEGLGRGARLHQPSRVAWLLFGR